MRVRGEAPSSSPPVSTTFPPDGTRGLSDLGCLRISQHLGAISSLDPGVTTGFICLTLVEHFCFKSQGCKEEKDSVPALLELTTQRGRWMYKREVLGM